MDHFHGMFHIESCWILFDEIAIDSCLVFVILCVIDCHFGDAYRTVHELFDSPLWPETSDRNRDLIDGIIVARYLGLVYFVTCSLSLTN